MNVDNCDLLPSIGAPDLFTNVGYQIKYLENEVYALVFDKMVETCEAT
jgi:hypothetical protein